MRRPNKLRITDPRFLGLFLGAATLSPGVLHAQSSVEDFRLGGSAFVLSEVCIRLTPDRPFASGSAWFKKPVDLSSPFQMRMSLVLGEKDARGADGIVFVLHPTIETGRAGEGMGFAGLSPSIGIEFDTYRNLYRNDPADDHLALMANGMSTHEPGAEGVLKLGNLEDGARHPLRITWIPGTRLEVELDGKPVAAYPGEVVERIFKDRTLLYWGLTAATGRKSNNQDVCIERLLISLLD